ncbi:MAG: sialidase family protein [Bryobacteraceae bacterium]
MSFPKKAAYSALLVPLAFIGVVVYAQSRNPQPGFVPTATQNLSRDILFSPSADFLSGGGLNALQLISGRIPLNRITPPPASEQPLHFEVFPPQPALATGEVRVNNPELDLRTLEDISSQSETAVAGFGRNILVAYNDSGQFTFAPGSSFTGYSRSADGGLTFTDLGGIPGSPSGANFGDPGLVVDRLGNFYAAGLAFESLRPPGTQSTIGIWKSTNSGLSWSVPVYPPPGVSGFSDKPFIAVDMTQTASSGNLYVSWTQFGSLGPQVPILFSRSVDGGNSFSPAIQLSQPADSCQGSSRPSGRRARCM